MKRGLVVQARRPMAETFRKMAHAKVDEVFDMYEWGDPLRIASEVGVTTTNPGSWVDDRCVIEIKPAYL